VSHTAPVHDIKVQEELHLLLTFALHAGEWSASRLTIGERSRMSAEDVVGRSLEQLWTFLRQRDYFPLPGIEPRSSQAAAYALYRLRRFGSCTVIHTPVYCGYSLRCCFLQLGLAHPSVLWLLFEVLLPATGACHLQAKNLRY
jgi:hypothetical protein